MMTYFYTAVVILYQRIISPLLPSVCRFYPTCSSYSIRAVRQYGFAIGICMTFRRLMRCHPFCQGGYDPVK